MSEDKIDLILSKLEAMEARLTRLEASAGNMDSHINFIDNLYATIKSPFHHILNMVSASSNLIGYGSGAHYPDRLELEEMNHSRSLNESLGGN